MPSILIADDDVGIRRLLQRALRSEGYTVTTATNGQEAVLQIQLQKPDLILLDLMMPVMTGWEVYHRLRSEGPTDLPIIVLTAGERGSRAQDDMPDATVLTKPFDIDNLFATIADQLHKDVD
jgi:two-component system, OmpR family, response regulator